MTEMIKEKMDRPSAHSAASFYGDMYEDMLQVMEQWAEKLTVWRQSQRITLQRDPVEHCKTRLKSPESILAKLQKKQLPLSFAAARQALRDLIGIRVITTFVDDVYLVAQMLREEENSVLVLEKDYIRSPKNNGYRSLHMIIQTKSPSGREVFLEIQIRTIAMDCWASLEHQLKYKRNIKNADVIAGELKRCADELASADLSLETIRDMIYQGETI